MYTIIYFSPTGNVKHLAIKLANNIGNEKVELLPLEFTEPNQLKKKGHLILLYPVHGFNAPRTVKRFVKNLPSDLFEKLSLIGVGCTTLWVNDAVSSDLIKVLVKKGYSIIHDEILDMPLTFIMSFPEELSKELILKSEKKIDEISQSIQENKISSNSIKFKSKLINFVGKAEGPAARLFGLELHANNACISCGLCWENCPEKNIKPNKKEKPAFGFNCMMCMRCIYTCPQKAISPRISKFIPIKKGYDINDHINKED